MMSATVKQDSSTVIRQSAGSGKQVGTLDKAAAAFGLSAAITIVFNTVLAWIKDAFDPLNNFMASLTGHHWITHGLANVAVFLIVGAVLTQRHFTMDGTRLAILVSGAVVVGGGGLALWFVLF
jgi:hypothetical protein